MDAELQAIPWMDRPALAPVGSVFCGLSPEVALETYTDLLEGSGIRDV
jgi:hypothetical protein